MITSIYKVLTFGLGGNTKNRKLYGWSDPEPDFTWTVGGRSAILIDPPPSPHGFAVEMTVHPFAGGDGPASQSLSLTIEGKQLGSMTLTYPSTIAVIAGPVSDGRATVSLIADHPDAAPAPGGGRMLAFAVKTMRLLALEHPVSPLPPVQPTIGWQRPVGPDDIEDVLGITARDLVLDFEMLAGNCEFGGMQRRCGVEPLSLLRFAGASATVAIEALDSGLDGIGETIEAYIADNGIREWMIHDRLYRLNYHTMISSNDIAEASIIEKERRKIGFLKRRFLEDLTESDKIFICSDRLVSTREEVLALFLALRRKSNRCLLWVRVADDAATAGTVAEILPGLTIGYIDRFCPPDDGTDISMEGWLTVLAKAWLLKHPETLAAYATRQPKPRPAPVPPAAPAAAVAKGNAPTDFTRAETHHRMAYALIQQGRDEAALDDARRSTSLDPGNAVFRILLSDLLARLNRLDDALKEARMAVALDTGSAHALGHLAHITQLKGDLDPARRMYQRAIAMDPGNDHLVRQLTLLLEREPRMLPAGLPSAP